MNQVQKTGTERGKTLAASYHWFLYLSSDWLRMLAREISRPISKRCNLERFSSDCRKTKTKAITPTNHNRNEQRDEPITIPSIQL